MTYYTSTTNVIYLGNYAQTDTHEYNYHDENAAAVLTGQTFNAGDMEIVSATFNSGYDHYVDDDDYGSGETFSYDVGAGHTTQTLDSTTVACVTVTAPDGSTTDIYVTLFQAQNGDLFMSDYNNCGYLDNLQISSIEITSFYSTNYSAYYAPSNVENTTIVPLDTSDGTVDGENTGEVMGLGYDDANAPNDQGGDVITNDDDVIFGNGGDDSIDGAGGNDTIYGDNVVGSNGYAQGELLVNGALEAGVGTGGQQYNADVEGWTSGAGAFEVWGSGFEHETSQDGGNFVELDRGGEVDQISQDVTTVDGSTYTLTVDAKQRIEGSDDQVEVYFGGTLVGVIQPGDEWQTFEFEVTGSGSDTLTLREPSSDNNSYGPLIDNVSLVGDIPGTDTGVDGADTIVGNDGDDTIYGGGENDTIYGDDVDGSVTTVRESFNWEGATDAEIDGGFSQNTGSVTVTYDRTADAGHHESSLNAEVLNVDGIDGGTEAIDTIGGLQSVNNGTDGRGTFEWTFSEEVENVEFNVNDIDGDGVVTITAFDADGNPIEVQLDGGANLTLVDTDSVAGVDTADSNGGYENNDSPNYNLQVTIPGPVSRIVVDHTQDGVNNSGVTVTDIFFDVPTSVTGDDTIEGNDGDDLIYGGGGNDVIIGDTSSATAGLGDNLIVNGSFENTSGMTSTGYGYVATGSIVGWTEANASNEIDVHNDDREGMVATEGDNWLDLEASPGNTRVYQDVAGVEDGETYQLTFDVSDSQFNISSDVPEENLVNVYWGGELVATIDPSNVGESDFETITLELVGGAGDGSNRLEFEGTGQEDGEGVAIDNVELRQIGADAPVGDDTIIGGEGDDVIYGDNATSEVSGNTDEDFAPTVTDNIDDSYGTETRSTYAVELVTLANGDLVMITSERDTSDDGIATYKIDNDPASATYGQVIGTDPNNSGDNDLGAKIDSIGDNSGGNIAGYGKIADLAAVTLDNGKTYVYTADDEGGAAGGAIGIAEIDADGNLTQLGHISDTETHDMKELTIAEVDGETFLIGLNSTSSTDALTVYKINDDGSLIQTDTIYDVDGTGENYLDGDDPFGSATLLESFTNSDGNTFVIAGGADDGVSLWTLDSTGQLTMRDARGDDEFKAGDLVTGTQTGLYDPAAATFAEVDGTTYVFVGGNDDDIVVFEVIGDPSNFDLRLVGQLDNAVNDISSMAFLPDGAGSGKLVVGGEQQGLEFYDITVNSDGTVSVALNTVAPDDGEPGAELLDSEDIDVEGGILVSASDNDNGVAVLTSGYTDDNSTSNGEGGDDVIEGGAGADMMFGEGGDDTFIVSSGSDGDGDVVVGGNGPDDTTDNDTLDLRGAGDVTITQEADENDAGATKGTVTFENGETLSFEGIETILADNGAPIVGDDTASTDEDTPVTIDVLSNDVDPEGTDLTVVSATSPNGDVVINADGTITFTPSDNFNGDTTISYTVEDEDGEQSTGTVSVSVAPVNDDPVATDDTATTDYLTPVTVAVLGNDTDVDGDDLTVTSATSPNGDVVINADGTITFTPAPGFDGDATIEYTVSDGQGGEDTATVTVTVADAPRDGIVDGTDGDDVIVDGYVDPDGDAIDANDAILPGETGNDDIVLAGDGDDSIASGDGNDEVFGGTGSDTISGGDDDDIIYGDDENGNLDTSGVDPVELNFSDVEPGSETAGTANTATAGDSVVYNNVATLEDGTQVSARLVLVSTSDPALQVDLASEEDYEVLLNANNDGTMNGETATFRLEFFDTNTGDPVELEPSVVFADLDQNVGQEILSITDPNLVNVGVPADSSLDVTYTPGGSLTAAGTEDNIDPNDPDSQIATVFGETSEIEFTLTSRGVNSGLNFGTTDGNDFEYIVPIAGDDTIDGDDGNDIIYGGGGNDVIADGAGNDSIFGGEGNDIIDDEPGTPNDSLGDDYVDGGEGDDTIYTGLGNDTLIGGEGDDLLSGEDGDDVIDGGEGNDLVYGGEGNDVIDTSNPTDPLPDLAYPGLWPADSDPSNDLDTVFGGAGNDTILTGDDADYIDAGEGDNYVDGGIDEDTIITGSGNDTVIGGEGDDTITTGAGDDLIYGGLDDSFPDAINIPDADGDLVTNNGQDTIDAGAGNDTVFGKDDDDVIYGGDGDDYLDGGVDEDEIYGGADSDTIIGGEAADQLFGGTGSDTFFGGTSGDVVVGGEDADNLDQDVLDLTGSNVDFITYTSPDNEDGVVTFDDGSTMTFSEIENVIPCFTPGTLIATARGERPVEDLQVGDRIITRDNGIQEIAWVGHKQFQGADLVRNPHLKPVLIKAGSLGNDLPERDMLVSPNHRLLVASDMTQLYFEESEVLAAAKHMVGSQGIHRVDVTQTTYIHFMFERHEVVLSDGAWTESFQPGDYSLKGIGNSQRNEIFELFPELREKQGLQDYQAARKSLKKHEAKLLVR